MFVITGNKIKLECKFDKSQNDGTIQVCPIIPVPLGIYVKKRVISYSNTTFCPEISDKRLSTSRVMWGILLTNHVASRVREML